MENKIQLFEKQHVRTAWDEDAEKMVVFSIGHHCVLTDQPDYKKVRNYWKWLKKKLKKKEVNWLVLLTS